MIGDGAGLDGAALDRPGRYRWG